MSRALIARLIKDDDAGGAVEYGMITAVIAVGLIVALVAFRDKLIAWFGSIGDSIRGTAK